MRGLWWQEQGSEGLGVCNGGHGLRLQEHVGEVLLVAEMESEMSIWVERGWVISWLGGTWKGLL